MDGYNNGGKSHEELKIHKHILLAVSKANQVLGFVKKKRRPFDTLHEGLLCLAYKNQVRPHFE